MYLLLHVNVTETTKTLDNLVFKAKKTKPFFLITDKRVSCIPGHRMATSVTVTTIWIVAINYMIGRQKYTSTIISSSIFSPVK